VGERKEDRRGEEGKGSKRERGMGQGREILQGGVVRVNGGQIGCWRGNKGVSGGTVQGKVIWESEGRGEKGQGYSSTADLMVSGSKPLQNLGFLRMGGL
jgi:hypothetical protein